MDDSHSQIPETNVPKPLDNKDASRKGRALSKWSTFFLVLACIATMLVAAMLVLPVFLAVAGIFSVFIWFVVAAIISIFTVFMIWTNKDAKAFFDSWNSFNGKLINSSNEVNDFTHNIIPIFLISGGALLIITWLFLIIGVLTDQARKKKYLTKIIVLIVFTLLYLLFLFINLKNYYLL